jgi:MoxR-like ATPase
MLLSHSVKDFCIVGPRGCGKSLLAERLAALLGYDVEPVQVQLLSNFVSSTLGIIS